MASTSLMMSVKVMHTKEQLHWGAFPVETWWIHDADVVFHELLHFPWLQPLEKENQKRKQIVNFFPDCSSALHRIRCSKNIWGEMLERNLLRPQILCTSSQSHALAVICTPSPVFLSWSTPDGGKRSTTVLISRGSLNSLLQFCLVIFKVLKIKNAFYCAQYKQSAPSGKVN